MAKRTTLYLEDHLVERMRKLVPERGVSALVNQLLTEHLSRLEEDSLREAYLAANQERAELDADWAVLDTEGWPD